MTPKSLTGKEYPLSTSVFSPLKINKISAYTVGCFPAIDLKLLLSSSE